jgi:hypothetical protein
MALLCLVYLLFRLEHPDSGLDEPETLGHIHLA